MQLLLRLGRGRHQRQPKRGAAGQVQVHVAGEHAAVGGRHEAVGARGARHRLALGRQRGRHAAPLLDLLQWQVRPVGGDGARKVVHLAAAGGARREEPPGLRRRGHVAHRHAARHRHAEGQQPQAGMPPRRCGRLVHRRRVHKLRAVHEAAALGVDHAAAGRKVPQRRAHGAVGRQGGRVQLGVAARQEHAAHGAGQRRVRQRREGHQLRARCLQQRQRVGVAEAEGIVLGPQ
mmetsp:Transcript_19975/g.52143  ORF Transcript_19975/g.52143 Transcript_19975/m.52143 type:complete len:233 (+) Transcript_19975:350-1048(+)